MCTLHCRQSHLNLLTLACEHVFAKHTPVLYLSQPVLLKTDIATLQLSFPQDTLSSVYIKELKSSEMAVRYLLEDLSEATPGLVILYTELSDWGWEAVAALQHVATLRGIPVVYGCPEAVEEVRLSAVRFFSEIVPGP